MSGRGCRSGSIIRQGQRGLEGVGPTLSLSSRSREIHFASVYLAGSGNGERSLESNEVVVVDRSFLAIATFLHRVPRDGDPDGKRKPGSPRRGDRDANVRDIPDGWIRVAL